MSSLNDKIVSSRVRLARNISLMPFPNKLSGEVGYEILKKVSDTLNSNQQYDIKLMSSLSESEKMLLVENNLISSDLGHNKFGAVLLNKDKTVSIMLNEEDHIRSQCILNGFNLKEAYTVLNKIDDLLIEKLPIAYSNKLGFITSCPTNLGTGMRASVMMFLPALSLTKQMPQVIEALSRLKLTVRGSNGEGSEANGYLYQISNQLSLPLSEAEIIESVSDAVKKVALAEDEARIQLINSDPIGVTNMLMVSCGILANSYTLSSQEFNKLYAQTKLAISLNLVKVNDMSVFDNLYFLMQKGHLIEDNEQATDNSKRDIIRAKLTRSAMKKIII